jgi:hypothetical protein
MPAAIQRFFIEPSFQRVTRPVVRRVIEGDHRLDAVGGGERLGQGASDAEAPDGVHVLESLA